MPVSDLPPTGTPTYPWMLYRGVVIGKTMERQGELLRVTLDLEDYNRLMGSLTKVGAPDGSNFLHQPDPEPTGTDVGIDPLAQTAGGTSTDAVYVLHFGWYFAPYGLTIDDTTWVDTVTGPSGTTLPDFSTALTDFKSFSDTLLAYMGPYARAWLDPELNLHITRLAAVGDLSDVPHAAPWAINDDDATGTNTVRPKILNAKPDYARNRYRIFVRGATPASSFWVTNGAIIVWAGEDYYDAPGAVTVDDANLAASWALEKLFSTKLTGTCVIPVGYDGWRVGQTAYFTCARIADDDYPFDEMPAPIQRVSGRLVGPGPGLTVKLQEVAVAGVVVGLEWAESLDGPEKAKVVIEIVDPDETFAVAKFNEVTIETDGTADIEYELAYGDIEPGDLVKSLVQNPTPAAAVQPLYHFRVTVNDPILPLLTGVAVPESGVIAQAMNSSEEPRGVPGISIVWVLLQWADDDMTIPSSSLSLDDATGVTDATGRCYTRIVTTGTPDCVAYEIQALALPIP